MNSRETVVFDFLRPHRSGNSTSDLVRITFLLRASAIKDEHGRALLPFNVFQLKCFYK